MVEKYFGLEQYVGQRITIHPRTEMNRKRLFTLQSWIDPEKLSKAIMFGNESEDIPITALVSMDGIHQILTLTGGNHRVGVACIENTQVEVEIVGIYNGERRWGFNKIFNKVRNQCR